MLTVSHGGPAFEHVLRLNIGAHQQQEFPMTVLQWGSDLPQGLKVCVKDVNDFKACAPTVLTVILADLDLWKASKVHELAALFSYLDLPDAFIAERLNSVTHSFGFFETEGGAEYSWIHSLYKNIEVQANGDSQVRELITKHHPEDRKQLPQADYSWHRSGYLCKIELKQIHRNDTSSHRQVTFLCFGAPQDPENRFNRLSQREAWRHAVRQPAALYQIVFEELYQQLETMTWRLSGVFGDMEHIILDGTAHPGEVAGWVKPPEMLTVAKSVVYLMEGAEAIISTVDSMLASPLCVQPTGEASTAAQGLRYQKGLFQSTQLRLKSFEKRMSNVINLSFNLIAQRDNHIMQRDSTSMKTIAVVTLLFLPTTTVATIFGTEFFDFGEEGFRVSRWIWLFVLLSLTISAIVFAVWVMKNRASEQRLLYGQLPLKGDSWGFARCFV